MDKQLINDFRDFAARLSRTYVTQLEVEELLESFGYLLDQVEILQSDLDVYETPDREHDPPPPDPMDREPRYHPLYPESRR
jgi:hypothetical protein